MAYAERARELFLEGYNCCQAVFLACTEDLGLDVETRARLISVLSNVRPKKTLAMIRACQQNDFRLAGRLQREMMELIGALFCEVNPIPVKQALALEGLDAGLPRLPLTKLSDANLPRLQAALAQCPDT